MQSSVAATFNDNEAVDRNPPVPRALTKCICKNRFAKIKAVQQGLQSVISRARSPTIRDLQVMSADLEVDSQMDLATRLRMHLNSDADMEYRHASRMRFSPSLSYGRHFGPPAPTAKQAAVMVLLEANESGWTIPLTERPAHLPDHPGQISLPGGRLEANESHLQAACREFSEELGTTSFPGELVGELQSIYVYNSDYFVRPFVAISPNRIEYVPCQREVERIIHLPIQLLMNDSSRSEQVFSRGQASWHSSTIHFDNALIWGATAIILGEFARILQCCSPTTATEQTTA